jgi:hypothetical protein
VGQVRPTLFAVIGLTLLAYQPPGAGQSTQTISESRKWAEELWEQAMVAKGGRERLHEIQTMAIFFYTNRSNRSQGPKRAYQAGFYLFPSRWWNWSDMRPSPLGVDAGKWVVDTPNNRYHLMRDQLYYLMETKWVRPIPVSVRKEVLDGVRLDVVRTEVQEGYDAEFFLDPTTHLPREVRIGKREDERLPPWSGLSLSDYAPCQGIQMPLTEKGFELSPHPLSYEINPEYDEKFFDRPARFELGPEAWRLKGGPKKPIIRCP